MAAESPSPAVLTFARWTFRGASIYGLIVLLPQYFLERYTSERSPPAITHPEFFYGFLGVAVAWQLAFWIISSDPIRYRALMIPAMVEKATFAGATIVLFLNGRLHGEMLAAGLLDLTLGVLFFFSWFWTHDASREGQYRKQVAPRLAPDSSQSRSD